jgi:predicted  nucleic acid-binding Zn-ribbon protein
LLFPDTPTPHDVTLGNVPSVVLPTFDATLDATEPSVPDAANTFSIEYQRALPAFKDFVGSGVEEWLNTFAPNYHANMAKLEARLNRDIDGGYALSDPVEQAMFDRLRDRIDDEANANREQFLANARRSNYVLPQGAISAMLDSIDQSASDRIAASATEVTIERAKIELQHVQFVMQLMAQLAQSLQGLVVQYAGVLLQVNAQAMEFAKTLAGILMDMFNASLELYKAKMQLLSILAQVYEVQLKAALAEYDRHRLELEQAKLTVEIDAQAVSLYEAQIRAQTQRIDAYVAQLNAIRQMAETEKLKIDVFGEQVKAYTALVGAKESEFNCYKAAITGDQALVEAYATTVTAYRASVEAAGEKGRISIAQAEAVASHNKNLIAEYESELEAYKAEINAESTRFDASARANAAALESYRTVLQSKIESLRLQFEQNRLDLEAAFTKFKGDLEAAVTNAQMIMTGVKITADTSVTAGQISAAIAQAAVSATNTMAALEEGSS